MRDANKAERRGRTFSDSLEDYERAAAAGPIRVKEALVSRHNQRMENLSNLNEMIRVIGLSSLAPVGLLDKIFMKYGVVRDRHPASYYGNAVDHLAWGVDSAVQTIRLLLSGQFVGAAVLARHQLERWNNLRAFNLNISKHAGETMVDYMARVWASDVIDHLGVLRQPPIVDLEDASGAPGDLEDIRSFSGEPESSHEHVHLSDGTEICPPALFALLSDILHATDGIDSLKWDAVAKCESKVIPNQAFALATLVADAVSLNLRVIRSAVGSMAMQRGDTSTLRAVAIVLDRFSEPDSTEVVPMSQRAVGASRYLENRHRVVPMPEKVVAPELWSLVPLCPSQGLSPSMVSIVERHASLFEDTKGGNRPAGRLFRDDEFVTFNFYWHRRASIRFALRAMEFERKALGDAFDIEKFASQELPYTLASEMAGLLAGWLPRSNSAAALALIASGLRSSYWLWLEDDDRAMAVLRSVLEQTCRVRVWRKNPDKAERLETSRKTTPRDWLNAAGWRRVEALNRALGEMAHSRSRPKWDGARELLAKLQIDVDPETSIYTARGSCLEFVVGLLCGELVESIKTISRSVGEAYEQLLEVHGFQGVQAEAAIEARLNHVWTHRATPVE